MTKLVKNNLGNFLVVCLIFLMVFGWIFSGWPQIWQEPPIPPKIQQVQAATESLYVDSVDATAWTTVGTSPYLDVQDQPTNYIYSVARNTNSGNYGFANSSGSGTINSVTLYIYAYGVDSANFTTYVNITENTGLGPPTFTWGWVNVDVSGILTSWAEVDAATVMFDRPNTQNEAGVDAAYLLVDYTAPSLTCNTTPPNIQFGTLTTSQVYTALYNTTTTVTSGAAGFTLSIHDSGNGSSPGLYNSTSTPTDIIGSANSSFTDTATLSDGTEGYGIQVATTTAGSGALTVASRYANKTGTDVGGLEQGSGNAVEVASSTEAVTDREIVITYKAAISPSNAPGDYKDTITYTCVAN